MKHIFLLLIIFLGSCHVHYHIKPKEDSKKTIPSGITLTGGITGYDVNHINNYLPIELWGDFIGKYDTTSHYFIDDTTIHFDIMLPDTNIIMVKTLNKNQRNNTDHYY